MAGARSVWFGVHTTSNFVLIHGWWEDITLERYFGMCISALVLALVLP